MTIEKAVLGRHDREWRNQDGSPKTLDQIAAKLGEEAGEAQGACIKLGEQRTDKDWQAELRKELGDVLVVVAVLAGRMGWTLDDLLLDRWATVRQRKSADYRERHGVSLSGVRRRSGPNDLLDHALCDTPGCGCHCHRREARRG